MFTLMLSLMKTLILKKWFRLTSQPATRLLRLVIVLLGTFGMSYGYAEEDPLFDLYSLVLSWYRPRLRAPTPFGLNKLLQWLFPKLVRARSFMHSSRIESGRVINPFGNLVTNENFQGHFTTALVRGNPRYFFE